MTGCVIKTILCIGKNVFWRKFDLMNRKNDDSKVKNKL